MTPQGWSKWTHREKGGEYSFLTVAKGTGPDHGVDFAYYLGTDKETGANRAFVRRMDSWHENMVPHPTAVSEYERRSQELAGEGEPGILDTVDLDDFDLEL
ncbi:hypothetical protein [uncultured Halomonas sp.]|uniref:hypothetical protein n=1 Tax=uncultured Halomonas sp. TaxID=173971 RepID=UPI00262465AE|nr:hypothetical protein [uncultured Halomonas sp.]